MPESPAMQTPPPSVARASPERLEDLFSPSEAPGSIPAAQEFVAPHDEEQPEVQHGRARNISEAFVKHDIDG